MAGQQGVNNAWYGRELDVHAERSTDWLSRTIPFNPVRPDGRVISQDAARKLVDDRIGEWRIISLALARSQRAQAFGRRLDQCMEEARKILDSRDAGELRNSEEAQAWVLTTERFRCEASEHHHRCFRLAEYIVHLHSVFSVPGAAPSSLPPMPEEIVHYVGYERQQTSTAK